MRRLRGAPPQGGAGVEALSLVRADGDSWTSWLNHVCSGIVATMLRPEAAVDSKRQNRPKVRRKYEEYCMPPARSLWAGSGESGTVVRANSADQRSEA